MYIFLMIIIRIERKVDPKDCLGSLPSRSRWTNTSLSSHPRCCSDEDAKRSKNKVLVATTARLALLRLPGLRKWLCLFASISPCFQLSCLNLVFCWHHRRARRKRFPFSRIQQVCTQTKGPGGDSGSDRYSSISLATPHCSCHIESAASPPQSSRMLLLNCDFGTCACVHEMNKVTDLKLH